MTKQSEITKLIFPTRLIALRTAASLSQTDAAKGVGVNLRTFQRYEHSERLPTIDIATDIAVFFGVDVNYLTGDALTTEEKDRVRRILSGDNEVEK